MIKSIVSYFRSCRVIFGTVAPLIVASSAPVFADAGDFPFTMVSYGEMDENYPFVDNNVYQDFTFAGRTVVTAHFVPDDPSPDYSKWSYTLSGTTFDSYYGKMKEQNGRSPIMVTFSPVAGEQEFCIINPQQTKYCTLLTALESDTIKPGVVISGPEEHTNSNFTVSFQFSETVPNHSTTDSLKDALAGDNGLARTQA